MQQNIDSDKVVQNLMASWQASGLKQKLIFTFAIIALFRLGAQLPIYGINNEVFQNLASGNNLIGFLDMFSGGALGKVSIFAFTVMFSLTFVYPTDVFIHKYLEPVYETMPGWKTDLSGIRSYDELPENAKKYIARVEDLIGAPVGVVSVGPDREQTIFRNPV